MAHEKKPTTYAPPSTIGRTPVHWDHGQPPIDALRGGHTVIDLRPDNPDDDRVWFFCWNHGEIWDARS